MRRFCLPLLLIPVLAACDMLGGGEDAQVTETRIDDLDSLEGTISDEMVDTDAVNEEPMIDSSSPDDAKQEAEPKAGAKSEKKPAPKAEAAPTPAPAPAAAPAVTE
jgi:hypothetical protein